jgi:hypothetical protein
MLLASVLTLALLAGAQRLDSVPADVCASRKPGASIEAVVLLATMRARDTTVSATVCVVPARSREVKLGSYHGELYFDSSATVVQVEKLGGGVRVENTRIAGQVNFAGAAPTGFDGRRLLQVVLRVRTPGKRPAVRLRMRELNATDGTSLLKQLATQTSPTS